MAACKLKKGDRIYECSCREATLIELITDPELLVQGSVITGIGKRKLLKLSLELFI